MRIGLSGLHGCGKTSLSDIFVKKGYTKVKNPHTFSSQKAREIATSECLDEIEVATIFFEDRLRCFLELDDTLNYVFDRWWIDVCLNVNQSLFKHFCEFYTSSVFTKDFVGVILDINPELAARREENYKIEEIRMEKEKFEKAKNYIIKSGITKRFRFISLSVEDMQLHEIYDEILRKVT